MSNLNIKSLLKNKNHNNNNLRALIALIIHRAGEGHIPSAYSIIDIIESLYSNFIRINIENPRTKLRDYFILSKGHGALALYVVLANLNLLSLKELETYGKFDGKLGGHPDRTKISYVECSTGSLGHGLPMAVGVAISIKRVSDIKVREFEPNIYCLIGDGELLEGSNWESLLLARHHKLDNLIIIIDRNNSADQILPLPNLLKLFQDFDADVFEVDGHNSSDLINVITKCKNWKNDKFKIIIANTIKGKGVSFIEGHGVWHHKIPNESELHQIYKELGY